MLDKTHMTIDAYLRQAGVKPARGAVSARFLSRTSDAATPFKALLDAAPLADTPPGPSMQQGMTIADYLNQRSCRPPSTGLAMDRLGWTIQHVVGQPSRDDVAEPAPVADPDATIRHNIARSAKKYRLPPRLIESVIRAESNFRADAVSPAGAQGLMQLMPATARELGVGDPFDIGQNIDGGSKYLRQMLDRFDGDLKLALAAYNAGPGTVERYQGHVPYEETRSYVQKVIDGVESGDAALT